MDLYEMVLQQAINLKGCRKALANAMGISESALSKKIDRQQGWTFEEIKNLLDITGHIIVQEEEYFIKMRFMQYVVGKTDVRRLL